MNKLTSVSLTQGTILDKNGRALNRYDAAKSNRLSNWGNLSDPRRNEESELDMGDRLTIAARVRKVLRDSPFVNALAVVLATHKGAPKLQYSGDNPEIKVIKNDLMYDWLLNMTPSNDDANNVNLIRTVCELYAGENFTYKRADGKVQILEPIEIGSDLQQGKLTGKYAGAVEQDGIIKQPDGTIVAYRRGRFKDNIWTYLDGEIIPAEFMIHDFDRMYPNQNRGIPKLAASLTTIKDLDEADYAKLIGLKAQAMHSIFIKKQLGMPVNESTEFHELALGYVHYGNPGEEPILIESKLGSSDYLNYWDARAQIALAPVGVPLEALKGFSNSSYAAGRVTWEQYRCTIERYRTNDWNRFWRPVIYWKSTIWTILEQLPAHDLSMIESYYPAIPSSNPQQDAVTDVLLLSNGLTTQSQSLAKRGMWLEDWLNIRGQEIAAIVKKANELGVDPKLFLPTTTINIQVVETKDKPNTV